jgi:hypothetical protein
MERPTESSCCPALVPGAGVERLSLKWVLQLHNWALSQLQEQNKMVSSRLEVSK